jgi:hypothetical protein
MYDDDEATYFHDVLFPALPVITYAVQRWWPKRRRDSQPDN